MTSRFGAFFDRYSAMPLNDLPVELVALILPHNLRPIQFRDHEERTRELLSYACSCRALRAAAETLLWQDVIVATPHQAGALLSALYCDKRGSRIRSLHVGSTRDEDAQDYELSELFSVLGDEVESLSLLSVTSLELTQLTLLPRQFLRVSSVADPLPRAEIPLPRSSRLCQHPPSHLRRVEISCARTPRHPRVRL